MSKQEDGILFDTLKEIGYDIITDLYGKDFSPPLVDKVIHVEAQPSASAALFRQQVILSVEILQQAVILEEGGYFIIDEVIYDYNQE